MYKRLVCSLFILAAEGCAAENLEVKVSVKSSSIIQIVELISNRFRLKRPNVEITIKTVRYEKPNVEVIEFDNTTIIKYVFLHCDDNLSNDLSEILMIEIKDYRPPIMEVMEGACKIKDKIRNALCGKV